MVSRGNAEPNYGVVPEKRRWPWADWLFLPWKMFNPFFANNDTARAGPDGMPWPLWRLNLYRYAFPNKTSSTPELSGWSPTHDGSFHVPARFGVAYLY